MRPFDVFEDDRVKVTAILVPHGPVFPSYAYRFDTADGSVTFSGDTGRSDNLAALAADTDVLVHEVIDVDYFARLWNNDGAVQHMQEAHTSSQDVGRIATAANAKSLVLSHIGPGDSRLVSDDQWLAGVTQTYGGPVTIGHDLTQIGVGQRQQG